MAVSGGTQGWQGATKSVGGLLPSPLAGEGLGERENVPDTAPIKVSRMVAAWFSVRPRDY
jgi:hypothetical protein